MKICFVTLEMAPTTWGGAGVLIAEATKILAGSGHEVVLVLDVGRHEYERFQWEDRRLAFPNPHNIWAYHAGELCAGIPAQWEAEFGNEHLWRSFRLHWAACEVARLEAPDIIEFPDYLGAAYHALSAKITQGAYPSSRLAVRLHNSIEVMEVHQPMAYRAGRHMIYGLEHQALRLAEHVLYPSESYYQEAYRPLYPEEWLGRVHLAPPALTDPPVLREGHGEPYAILFYGRLYGFKGVVGFVDAAARLLSQGVVPPGVRFVLVGSDSGMAPDGSPTYREYLMKRVPRGSRSRFDFPGHIDRQALEELLPDVLFAVFPNLFESFCYAAHEIYEAGVPLVVNAIPAFRDHFRHEANALVFDGSTGDLADKMRRMLGDPGLRRRLSRPYSLQRSDLGAFYLNPGASRWPPPRVDRAAREMRRLLICVLDDLPERARKWETAASVEGLGARLVLLAPVEREEGPQMVRFLGKTYTAFEGSGLPLAPDQVVTGDYLVVARAGDVFEPDYLRRAAAVLRANPELSFVGCWKRIVGAGGHRLDATPLDAVLETLPQLATAVPTRAVMRTEPGQSLGDLFVHGLGQLGEIEYLWRLDDHAGPGVVIPEVGVTPRDDADETLPEALLSHLLVRETSPRRMRRLALGSLGGGVRERLHIHGNPCLVAGSQGKQ